MIEGIKQLSHNRKIGLSFVPTKQRTKFYESCGFKIIPRDGLHKAIYHPK